MKEKYRFTVILQPQPGGGFTVLVPALPEVATEGETEEEALAMARDAIRLVLDYRKEQGLPAPKDATPAIRKVMVAATS
jgi:antitoxin HicB